jgi:hypothetical protein
MSVQGIYLDKDRSWFHLFSELCRMGELRISAGNGHDELTMLALGFYVLFCTRGQVRNISFLVDNEEAS